MLPPQVLFGAGVLLGKAAKWAFGGGGSDGGSGGGGGAGGGDDCHEGWLPNSDRFKWLAVPASRARHVTLGPDVCTYEHFMAVADAELRKADRKGRREEAEHIAYTIGYVRGIRKKFAAAGYVTFIIDVS